MALWKDSSSKPSVSPERSRFEAVEETPAIPLAATPASGADTSRNESLIAAGLTIEGKIQGSGHVRLAGKFKGDVDVQGDVTIEAGASLNGGVRAKKVVIAGEVEGNIDAASVQLEKTAVLNGDLKAGSLTVAAGSRMRGQVEFGWSEGGVSRKPARTESSGETAASS